MVTLMYGTAQLLLYSSTGNYSSSGGGVVFFMDVVWLFFLTFVRNMVIGSWLRCFFNSGEKGFVCLHG